MNWKWFPNGGPLTSRELVTCWLFPSFLADKCTKWYHLHLMWISRTEKESYSRCKDVIWLPLWEALADFVVLKLCTPRHVDHEVPLQFASAHSVKILVVVADKGERHWATDARIPKNFVYKLWENRSSICLWHGKDNLYCVNKELINLCDVLICWIGTH